MKNINTKFYLFGCFARSLDHYHVNENIIHIIGSIFYSEVDYSLKILDAIKKKNIYILRIMSDSNIEFNVIHHKDNIIEFQINYNHFFNLYKNNSIENKNLESFIEMLISSNVSLNSSKINILNDVLFIFENLNWFKLQLLFRLTNVIISGGSISKRHILSTVNFKLCFYLYVMGFEVRDVYASYKYLSKEVKNNDIDIRFIESDKSLMLDVMCYILEENKNKLNKFILDLENDILRSERDISSLKSDISIRKNKLSESKQLNSKRLLRWGKKIEENKNYINSTKDKISLLKIELSKLNKEQESLKELPIEELKIKYYKDYHNIKLQKDLDKFSNILRKMSQNPLGLRRYSTVSNLKTNIK